MVQGHFLEFTLYNHIKHLSTLDLAKIIQSLQVLYNFLHFHSVIKATKNLASRVTKSPEASIWDIKHVPRKYVCAFQTDIWTTIGMLLDLEHDAQGERILTVDYFSAANPYVKWILLFTPFILWPNPLIIYLIRSIPPLCFWGISDYQKESQIKNRQTTILV